MICSLEDFFRELFETFFVSIAYASKDDVVLMCANDVALPMGNRKWPTEVPSQLEMGNRELANRGTQRVENGQLGVYADQRTESDIQTNTVVSTPHCRRS